MKNLPSSQTLFKFCIFKLSLIWICVRYRLSFLLPHFPFVGTCPRFSFDLYVSHFSLPVGTYADSLSGLCLPFLVLWSFLSLFLYHPCFQDFCRGGFLAFLYILLTSSVEFLAFLYNVLLQDSWGFLAFLHMSHLLIQPQNLSDDALLFINIPCIPNSRAKYSLSCLSELFKMCLSN